MICSTCNDSGTVYVRRGDDEWDAEDCPRCPDDGGPIKLAVRGGEPWPQTDDQPIRMVPDARS